MLFSPLKSMSGLLFRKDALSRTVSRGYENLHFVEIRFQVACEENAKIAVDSGEVHDVELRSTCSKRAGITIVPKSGGNRLNSLGQAIQILAKSAVDEKLSNRGTRG